MPAPAPPTNPSQAPAPQTCSVIVPASQQQAQAGPGDDVSIRDYCSSQRTLARNRHAYTCAVPVRTAPSSPLSLRTQHAGPDVHINIPSSPFATASSPTSPPFASTLDQSPSGSMLAYSPVPGSPETERRSDGSAPPSPSKSPLRRIFSPVQSTSPPSPDVSTIRTASQHFVGTIATPGRCQALYAACLSILNTLSVVCIVSFAVSWHRTYNFDAARADLITTLRYILLLLGPLSLWLLPTLAVISALMAWPRIASAPAPADPHPDASSPISFHIPTKPRSFDSTTSEAYTIAAASAELHHDTATPRFGFTVRTDPQHGGADGALRPLTPQDIAAVCLEGAHRVADTLSGHTTPEHRQPLLPATAKRRPHGHARGAARAVGARMCSILSVWLRHEALLAVLCALAGCGTFALALLDRDVLAHSAGVTIVTQSTPRLQHLARVCSTFVFCLYSILVTSECCCAVLSVWCHTLLRRQRDRRAA